MRRRVKQWSMVAALVTIAIWAGASMAAAQSNNWWDDAYEKDEGTPTHVTEYGTTSSGQPYRMEQDWVRGEGKFCMIGSADAATSSNMAHAEGKAIRAAQIYALASLAESVQGVRVTGSATAGDISLQSDAIRTQFDGFIKGHKFSKPRVARMPDGSIKAEVCAGFDLVGKNSVASTVLGGPRQSSDPGKRPDARVVAPKPPEPHTGIIVDASGMNLKPGLGARIVTETGREVYGRMDVTREYALVHGTVGYNASVRKAKRDKETAKRVGKNPLVVEAIRPAMDGGTDVIVSSEDAGRILAADRDSGALADARVVFVLN